jgi:antitoxin FitA
MATIQIRDVPEDAYEVIRRRARASGQSLQSYMRDVVIDFATAPTAAEILAALDEARTGGDAPGPTRASILAALAADRR